MSKTSTKKQLAANGIQVIDNFLSPSECNRILFSIDHNLWYHSEELNNDGCTVASKISHCRRSHSQYESTFNNALSNSVVNIEDRLSSNFSFVTPRNFESWQITQYGYGDEFEAHLDCLPKHSLLKGKRDKTLLLYLHSPKKGGETYFRALNIWLSPKQGRLVIWDNLLPNGNCNYAMIHAGQPVKQGIKVILQTWQHQHIIEKSWRLYEKGKSGRTDG